MAAKGSFPGLLTFSRQDTIRMGDKGSPEEHEPQHKPVPDEKEDQSGSETQPDSKAAQPAPPDSSEQSSPEAGTSSEMENADSGRKLNRTVLVVLLAGLALALVPIFRLFIIPVILAATFATLFYPLFRWVGGRIRSKGWASIATCLVLLLGLLIPAYILIHLVALQTIDLYSTAEPKIRELLSRGEQGLMGELQDSRIVQWLRINQIDWRSVLQDAAKTLGRFGTTIVNKTSAGLLAVLGNLAIMLFTMFYFFKDGETIVNHLRYISPLRRDYEDLIFSRFLLIARATVKGTILIGLAQGSIGGLSLLIFGVDTWLLWGFVMIVLSIIPLVGAWLVTVPAGIIQILLGNLWQGIGILAVSTIVISNVDNLLRPRLVGQGARMHDLVIFFSTLGGIAVFGVMGFIIGPVITALFVTVLDIYGVEFKPELSSEYTGLSKEQSETISSTPPGTVSEQ